MRTTLAVVAALLLIPGLSYASMLQGEQTQGEIAGTVADSDGGMLPGATVTLEGDNLIAASRTTTSNASGAFRYRNLRPGDYTVTVALSGFQSMAYTIRVNVGTTGSVNAVLALAGVEETVLVTSETPLIQQAEVALTSSFSEDLIQNVPVAREFSVVPNFAPGVSDKGAYGASGDGSESTHRIGAISNAYKLNGVDVTEVAWGTTWVNPSVDTIAEIQFVGIGASAEFGSFSGATVNIVTKGGTNEFHGSASYYFSNDSVRGDNSGDIIDLRRGSFNYDHDVNFALGGPIIPRKLMFFANAGWQKRSEAFIADSLIEAAGFSLDTYQETWRRWRWHGRLDFLLNDRNTFGAMINHDPGAQGNIGLNTAGQRPETANASIYGSTTWLASWQAQPSDNTYVDLRYSGYNGYYDQTPLNGHLPRITDYSTGIRYASAGFESNEFNARDEVRGSLTQYVDDFLGSAHDLKLGFEYNNAGESYDSFYTGKVPTDKSGSITVYPSYGAYGYASGWTYDSHISTGLKRTGGFIQDDVTVSDRLNLNLGVRYDEIDTQDTWGSKAWSRTVCCNFNDGRGINSLHKFKHGPTPRLGLSFDVTGNGQAVAHGSFGRYYEKINAWNIDAYAGDAFYDQDVYYGYLTEPFDFENWTEESVLALWDTIFTEENFSFSNRGQLYPIDPDLDGMHTDVFNVGVEVEASRDWVLGLDFIHKDDGTFIIWDDSVVREYTPYEFATALDIPGHSGQSQTLYACTDCSGQQLTITNNDFYDRKHKYVTLSLERRASRGFNFNTSLTYGRSSGTGMDNNEGSLWGNAGRSYHKNPNFTDNPFQHDFRLQYSRKWNWKVLANYRLPGDILVSAFWNLQSGRPWEARLSRFAIDSESGVKFNDGRLSSLPIEKNGSRTWAAMKQLDIRLQKGFEMSGSGRVEIIADLFNALNDDQPTDVDQRFGRNYAADGGSRFGLPSNTRNIILPRQLRVGARVIF